MTETILPSTGLISLLQNKTIFLDANVFIGALCSDSFVIQLVELREKNDAEFLTISSAVYEFTRNSKSLAEFNDKRNFVNDLVNRVISVGPLLENPQNDVFSLVMSKLVSGKDSDYTDFLLATCLYQYSKLDDVYLLTSDLRSMPRDIFDVRGSITSVDKQLMRHYVVYSLNKKNFASLVETIK